MMKFVPASGLLQVFPGCITSMDHRGREPIVVSLCADMAVVIPHRGLQQALFRESVFARHKAPHDKLLKSGNIESPPVDPVVLVIAVYTHHKAGLCIPVIIKSQIPRVDILFKLQLKVGVERHRFGKCCRHITVIDIIAPLLPEIPLKTQVGLNPHLIEGLLALVNDLEMIDVVIRKPDVAVRINIDAVGGHPVITVIQQGETEIGEKPILPSNQ